MPNWQPEKPSAPGCIFPVVLFCFYLHFMISHLEGKTERAIFPPPSALQGVEQILNSMKWSCQGLKAFSGPNHLSVHLGAGWVKYLISCQQNPVLFRFHGRRKKRKYKISEMRGRYMSKDHFFCSHSKHWRILSWPELCIVEEFLWPRSTFLL